MTNAPDQPQPPAQPQPVSEEQKEEPSLESKLAKGLQLAEALTTPSSDTGPAEPAPLPEERNGILFLFEGDLQYELPAQRKQLVDVGPASSFPHKCQWPACAAVEASREEAEEDKAPAEGAAGATRVVVTQTPRFPVCAQWCVSSRVYVRDGRAGSLVCHTHRRSQYRRYHPQRMHPTTLHGQQPPGALLRAGAPGGGLEGEGRAQGQLRAVCLLAGLRGRPGAAGPPGRGGQVRSRPFFSIDLCRHWLMDWLMGLVRSLLLVSL